MYCFKKDLPFRWSAKQLLLHPWIARIEKPKIEEKPKVVETKKDDPKKSELAAKLAKFAQDDEEDDVKWPDEGEDDVKWPDDEEDEKWPDDEDENQTIVKGNDIAKRLQQLKLLDRKDSFSSIDSDTKSDTIVKGNSIQRRILAMTKTPQDNILAKEVKKTKEKKTTWIDDDEDDEFSFAKGKKLTLQLNLKKDNDDQEEEEKGFDDDLMELFQTGKKKKNL